MSLPENDLSALIEVLVQCALRNDYQKIKIQALSNRFNIPLIETENILGFLIELMKKSLNWMSQGEIEFKQNLLELGFQDAWISNVGGIISKNTEAKNGTNYMPRIEKLIWRIDISLCNSNLQRVMSPIILWNVKLTDGKSYTIEISSRKFHELRFNVASILKEMYALNSNAVVKK